MADDHDALLTNFWSDNLEELDREIERLAVLCGVRLLDPGVMDRVLLSKDGTLRTSTPTSDDKALIHE
jgi:hypothetical protein